MYNTAFRLLNNRVEAEDILQESFMDAFHKIAEFRNESTFGAWLKKIVVNKSLSQLKKWNAVHWLDIETVPLADKADTDMDDEEWFVWKINNIMDAIQELPAGYRTVIILYAVEGYPHEKIAGLLGVAKSTVRTQYIRAKKKLLTLVKEND
jgi:RNA polymerase sigma factor (sigma-70 family)